MRRLALLVPITLLLASCGGHGRTAEEVVTRAPQATVDAATARLRMVLAFDADGSRLDVDGAVDFTHDRYAMAVALHDAAGAVRGAAAEARRDGRNLYLQLPAAGVLLPGVSAQDWMRLDLRAAGTGSSAALGQSLGLDSNDPRELLTLLEATSPDGVRDEGPADVDGVPTTRYVATVDVDRVLAGERFGLDRDALRRFVADIAAEHVTVTAWIDHQGRVRQLQVPLPQRPASGGGTLRLTLALRDFGRAVDVAPPTDHVVDVSDRLAELFGHGG